MMGQMMGQIKGQSKAGIKHSRMLVLFGLLFGLNACVVHQSPIQEIDPLSDEAAINAKRQAIWQTKKPILQLIDSWKIKGKISAKAGTKGGHATLRWDKQAEQQQLEIFGPLGSGRVKVSFDGVTASLLDTKGAAMQGGSISQIINQRLGWPLPFDQLRRWIVGLPASDSAKMQWDDQGRISTMNDAGWQINYLAYQSIANKNGARVDVPQKLELSALPGTLRVFDKNGAFIGEDFFVRLIIKNWQ